MVKVWTFYDVGTASLANGSLHEEPFGSATLMATS